MIDNFQKRSLIYSLSGFLGKVEMYTVRVVGIHSAETSLFPVVLVSSGWFLSHVQCSSAMSLTPFCVMRTLAGTWMILFHEGSFSQSP